MEIEEVLEHVKYQIANTPIRQYPFPHFVVENVFPESYYQQILENWPGHDRFKSIAETGRTSAGAYRERHIVALPKIEQESDWKGKAFWEQFAAWFLGAEFLEFIVKLYLPYIQKGRQLPPNANVTSDGLLVQDHENYAIGPHTDAAHRLVSTLFYCPEDDSQSHLGTSVYVPKGNNIPIGISPQHYPRENFKKIYTAPFVPNTMFGFVVSPNSFHGVDQIKDEEIRRNVILHFVKLNP